VFVVALMLLLVLDLVWGLAMEDEAPLAGEFVNGG